MELLLLFSSDFISAFIDFFFKTVTEPDGSRKGKQSDLEGFPANMQLPTGVVLQYLSVSISCLSPG